MKIPVFHDDQHGTAIVAAAALVNGLSLVGKKIGDVKTRLLRRRRGSDRLHRLGGADWPRPEKSAHR